MTAFAFLDWGGIGKLHAHSIMAHPRTPWIRQFESAGAVESEA